MKTRIDYTPAALRDLDEIWFYLAREADIETADRFTRQLTLACEKITTSPRGYRFRPELASDLRSYPHKRYVVFYYVVTHGITIARILHSARDIDTLFDD